MAISRSPSIISSSDQLLPLSFYNTFLTSRSRSRSISPNICSFSGSVRSLGLKSEARRRRTFFEIDATSVGNAVGVGDDLPGDYEWLFPKKDPIERRRAGVFLHPSSLPGPYGIGDIGREAFRFLDWLHEAGCSVWQGPSTAGSSSSVIGTAHLVGPVVDFTCKNCTDWISQLDL